MAGLVTVMVVYDMTLAHVARSMLESAGLTCHVADEHLAGINWLYTGAIGGIRIQVPTGQAGDAVRLLAEDFSIQSPNQGQDGLDDDTRQALTEHDVCPVCASPDIERCNLKRWAMLIMMYLGAFIFFTLKWRKCRQCGRRFKWRAKLGLS